MSSLKGNEAIAAAEAQVQRNPHGDFKTVESGRDAYVRRPWTQVQTPLPSWKAGGGANRLDPGWREKAIVDIDPHEPGRPAGFNYKLLISAIVPRPIGFVSSIGPDGGTNLAPFSYTQVVNHDPPTFVIGFAGSVEQAKDSLRNILDTKELVINMISEHFIEAANYTSINAPYRVSEWDLSGLTQLPSDRVRPARVHESVFTAECRLVEHREWRNKDGKVTGVTIFAEAVMFHVREDAINEDRNLVDPAVLRPVSRLGGITYSTIDTGFELPRPDFDKELESGALKDMLG